MSQNATPQAAEGHMSMNDQQSNSSSGTNNTQHPSSSSVSSVPTVSDSTAVNSRELLNAYVYDFILKSGFTATASAFFKEANIPVIHSEKRPTNSPPGSATGTPDLPASFMTMDAPQGFLYEWWQIFWDVFNARTQRGGTTNATQYYHYVNLKQKQDHLMNQQAAAVAAASTVINGNNTSMTGTPVTSAAQDIGVLMPQQQQQQQQAQMGHPPQQVPMAQQQRVNARMQQPQPQQQQQQGQSMPMHPQAAAQAQMNTLRQQQIAQQAQAAQVAAQAVSQRGSPSKRQRMDNAGNGSATEITQTSSPNLAMSSQQQQQQQQQHPPMPMPQGMMIPNQFGVPQQYAMFAAAQAAQQGQSQQKFNQYMIPNFQGQPQQQMLMHQQMHQPSVHMQHDQQHPPPPPPQTFSNPNDFFHEMPKQNNPGATRVNDTAIKDYEKQLRLMESQNRRRLDVHRNAPDSKDPNSPGSTQFAEYSAMLSQMPPQHAAASIMQQRASPATKASPTTKSPANGAGPPANGKQKKAPRKARKNSSSVPATPLTPANNQPTPQTNIPPTPQNTTPQQTPQSSAVGASQVMAGKKGIKRKNSITTPTIKEDEPFILSSTAGKPANGSSLNKVQGPVSSSSSHMGSDVPSSAVNDQTASTFLHDFSTASNDIFDFDSLLTANQENAGNLGLTEVFNWGESVGTGDL
ncbi:hypothetical protein KL921_002866 [Ogataea angusta]|uniref:LisH domain-containing protein n=1 Tax=Pichia angusta TaxID=870730 RepID=A0ABQ7RSM9_PICAN|nr:hypothetical protein KL921_002866 [Ogataea angusta]KAG7839921.1 hypothetical protein KL942_002720 [Ogataea angusta]KAG7846580.1 hypothetical protein KL940_004178 [Ogataea angusta]